MTDPASVAKRSHLQIQPVRTSREKWGQLAESEGLGYEVLELSAPPALNESGLFQNCLEWYKDSGRAFSLHGCFIDVNPASGDSRYRELSQEKCRESCRLAKEIGARNVVFHSSCFPFLRGPYLEGWAALSAEFYEELAHDYDLMIYIENSPDINPDPILALMEIIRDDRIGVCLDLGHINYSNASLSEWFDALGDRTGYLHLSDNKGVYDDHLALGDGTVDWFEADRLYRALGRSMPMTLEVGHLDNVRRSIDYLKENRLFGME